MLQHDGSVRAFWWSRIRVAALMVVVTIIQSCTGSVSNLASGMAGASGISIITKELSGIVVGDVTTGISTVGGTAPLKFEVSSGELPPGLSLDQTTGLITGTIPPSAVDETYGVSITVTDSANLSAMRTYSGTVSGGSAILAIGTTELSDFIAGVSYSYPIVVFGGTKPFKFEISSGSLPTGISLNSKTGLISGTPTANSAGQAFAFVLRVADDSGQSKTSTFLGTVKASMASNFAIITSTIPTPTAGSAYGASIGVTGGTGPYSFSISAGALPSGLSLNPTSGLISGTVAFSVQGAPYLFSVRATDSTNLVSTVPFSGFINTYATSVLPTSLPGAKPGEAYNVSLVSVGGQSPYSYAITSGSLPSGLTLDAAGVLYGTVSESEAGTSDTFTIRSADFNGIVSSATFTISTSSFPITLSTTTLNNAIESSSYTNNGTTLSASGGTGPYTYEYSGSLPSGVALTSSGAFFGAPASGTGSLLTGTQYTIYVRVRDVLGRISAKVSLTLTVNVSTPVVDSVVMPNAVLANNYNHTITASGGRPPYIFSFQGSLPTGITMSTTGSLSGLVTGTAGCPASQFTVRVTDSLNQLSAASTKCITTMAGVMISSTSFPVVVIGANYDQTATALGGSGAGTYTFSSSNLPQGLTINPSTGKISGYTNAAVGDYTGYVTVTDTSSPPLTNSRSFVFKVRNPLAFSAASLPRGAAGRAYNSAGYQLMASGGEAPYTFTLSSGSLPSGLSLSSTGLITGTPANSSASYGGAYTFAIAVKDALGQSTNPVNLTMNISIPPKIAETKMPVAVVGNPYAYDILRIGGVNEFDGTSLATRLSYFVSVSSPPATTLASIGLNYSTSTGRIYGQPTVAGTYQLAVSVTDQHGFTGSSTLDLKVNSSGRTFDLKTPRFSEPCTANGTNAWCSPTGYEIDRITGTSQQFMIYVRNETWPLSVQIAKIDETGRIPSVGENATTINIPLTTSIGQNQGNFPPFLKVADMDQDGRKDIVISDRVFNQVCVLWNMGTADNSYGMPSGFSNTNLDCFPIPNQLGNPNLGQFVFHVNIRDDLRPDSTNYGSRDIVVTSPTNNNNINAAYIMKNNCGPSPSKSSFCTTANRPRLFDGYGFLRTTVASQATNSSSLNINTAAAGAIALTASPNGLVGMPVAGAGIASGTYITATTTNTISLSRPTIAAMSAVNIVVVNGSYVSAASLTSGSATFTAAGANASWVGRQICSISAGQCQGSPVQTSTFVTSVSGTTVTMSKTASATGAANVSVFGPQTFWPWITTSGIGTLRDSNFSAIGWYFSPKPNFADGSRASSSNDCPSIAVAGNQTSSWGAWVYVAKQGYSGGVCDGNFITHNTADEWLSWSNIISWPTPFLLSEDFNNDGLTDFAISATNVNSNITSSASIRFYLPTGNANIFTNGTTITSQMQNRATVQIGAGRMTTYCLDGSTSCNYPSIAATCSTYGCLSVLPNQCSEPGCTTPFEGTIPSLRIDYPAPTGINEILPRPIVSTSNLTATANLSAGSAVVTVDSAAYALIQTGQTLAGPGVPSFAYVRQKGPTANQITLNFPALSNQSNVTITLPNVPTRNDIAVAGWDQSGSWNNNQGFFQVFPRNGMSTSDPLKGASALDSFPASFIQAAEIGMLKITDINNDNRLDLFSYAVNQGFVGSYVSSTSGGVNYNIGASIGANYVSRPDMNGCPNDASECFPDPIFNNTGVQQNFPTTSANNFAAWYTQYDENTMDTGDMNNDGIPDVALVGFFSRGFTSSLGASSGDLLAPTLYDFKTGSDFRPRGLNLADLDNDGVLDVIMIGINGTGTQTGVASWFKGNGDGTFQAGRSINHILNNCIDPRSVATPDIDQDGRPEIVVLCYTSQIVWISRRHSDGSWVLQSGLTLNTGGGGMGTSIAVGRLTTSTATGVDIAVVGVDQPGGYNNSVRIINNVGLTVTNTGTGAFSVSGTPSAYMKINGFPVAVRIADLNADGSGDLAISMNRTMYWVGNWGIQFYTCISNGTGTCGMRGWDAGNFAPSGIAVGDVNNDGLPEIFVGTANAQGRLIYRTITRMLNTSY